MTKTYQPQVLENGTKIVESLLETGFFEENQIEDHTYALPVICDFLTEKFIKGELHDDGVEVTEEEFINLLKLVNAICHLKNLKKKGFVDSYEDENTKEIFFLNDRGKAVAKALEKDQ